MSCNEHKDNRESCGTVVSSSCVPYTGHISDTIKDDFKCKPNINDLFKKLQEMVDAINVSLGDNKKIKLNCFEESLDEGFSQEQLNQLLITELCLVKEAVENDGIDPASIKLAISLLCLEDPSCEPKEYYNLNELFTKLIGAYCSLLTRVKNIETLLNI